MPFYADLHIHSKYSRACSRDCDLEHLAWWARRKGVTVVGSGDFTHPAWFEHLRENLEPAEPGLFRLREQLDRGVERTLPVSCRGLVRFMLSVEISTIYKRAERTRKVHHLVYVPDLEAAERFNRRLGRIGNIASDGRPILGLDSRDLLEITLESGPGSYLVPAHAWTPWFAVLGSKSGFDAVDDCYLGLADHIFALETGLSSDPAMNWRVSSLDRFRLVSNSDAHSPPMLGREACVFSSEMDYFSMRRALETGEGYGGTVEFFPEEGKYHLDGHRKCNVCLEPPETRRRRGRCPVCGKPLTIGVLHRVEELADRPQGARPEGAAGFRSLVPLPEVMGEILRVGPRSKAVARELAALTGRLGPELGILTEAPLDEVGRAGSPLLAEAIGRLRRGQVLREAGYDGEYGVIRLFKRSELERRAGTAPLFEPSPVAEREDPVARPSHADAAADADAEAEVDGLLGDYDALLRERDLVDFDDLLALPVILLGGDRELAARYRDRWRWISVDEYQDVDELQYRLLRLLTTTDGNLCAIGDPDQAIYGFRGADVGFFLRFRQDFPSAASVHLTRNYRSSAAIVGAALQAVAPGTLVRGRVLRAVGERAAPPRLKVHRAASEAAEAEFVVHTIERLLGGSTFFSFDSGRVDGEGEADLSFGDVAVLYRTDAQAAAVAEALSRAGMPFQKRSHDRLADLPGVQAVVRALHDTPDAGGGDRDSPVLTRVRRAAETAEVAAADLELLVPLAERCGADLQRFLGELALGAQVDSFDPRADRVWLLTLHAAKGLEFPVVFMVGCEDGLLPMRFGAGERAAEEVAEERRLFFVGMTRARSHLYLSWAARRARHGTVRESAPSPFLAAIDDALLERLFGEARGGSRPARPTGDQLSLL